MSDQQTRTVGKWEDSRRITTSRPQSTKLNVGSGTDYKERWVNVDVRETVDPDIVHDIEETPWPLKSNKYSIVLLDNVFEHTNPETRLSIMNELDRVTIDSTVVIFRLPVPKIGIGWDVTHYSVPEWTFANHPQLNDTWEIGSVSTNPVGIGRVLPDRVRRELTRWSIVHAIDEVEIKLTKQQ